MARSHKPIVWGLFAAGGTVAAFFLPVMLLLTGLGVVLGLFPAELLSYENLTTLLANPLVRLVLFGVVFLVTWHAAHRLRITAHDFGIRADTQVAIILYGVAAIATLILAATLIQL
jgi:fumarate reductase subunit D